MFSTMMMNTDVLITQMPNTYVLNTSLFSTMMLNTDVLIIQMPNTYVLNTSLFSILRSTYVLTHRCKRTLCFISYRSVLQHTDVYRIEHIAYRCWQLRQLTWRWMAQQLQHRSIAGIAV